MEALKIKELKAHAFKGSKLSAKDITNLKKRYTEKNLQSFRDSGLSDQQILTLLRGPKKVYDKQERAAFIAAGLSARGYRVEERPYDPKHGHFTTTSVRDTREGLPTLTMSYGNSKLGKHVAAVNLTPIGTCMRKVPCASLKGCYAIASWFMYAHTCRPAWRENTSLYRSYPDLFEESIRRLLEKVGHKVELFRWFSSGDFMSQDMVTMAIAIADQFNKVPFLAFTKRYDFEFPAPAQLPPNFSLIYSQWPGWTPCVSSLPRPVPHGASRAWVQNMPEDKVFPGGRKGVRFHESRVPSDAFVCPGQCSSCKFCWNATRLGRDVVFMYH